MSNRSTLRASKLNSFVRWAGQRGFKSVPIKDLYEVARLDPPDGSSPLIFYKRDRTDHVTIPLDGIALVKRFVRQSRVAK